MRVRVRVRVRVSLRGAGMRLIGGFHRQAAARRCVGYARDDLWCGPHVRNGEPWVCDHPAHPRSVAQPAGPTGVSTAGRGRASHRPAPAVRPLAVAHAAAAERMQLCRELAQTRRVRRGKRGRAFVGTGLRGIGAVPRARLGTVAYGETSAAAGQRIGDALRAAGWPAR